MFENLEQQIDNATNLPEIEWDRYRIFRSGPILFAFNSRVAIRWLAWPKRQDLVLHNGFDFAYSFVGPSGIASFYRPGDEFNTSGCLLMDDLRLDVEAGFPLLKAENQLAIHRLIRLLTNCAASVLRGQTPQEYLRGDLDAHETCP